jgi:hypothetical protein
MPLNGNIITDDDIENLTNDERPSPPALVANPPGSSDVKAPTADDYITKLLT